MADKTEVGWNMLGTIVNTGTIIVGSAIGSLIKRGIKDEYVGALYTAIGVAATLIGVSSVVSNMPDSKYPVLFIVSLALGGLIGTILKVDGRFNGLVGRFSNGNLAQGLSAGVLFYCIGTLSILGPIQSALYGDNTYLFTNATLDLVTSMVLASTYGIGMALAAIALFLWQGGIYLCASALSGFISAELMCEVSIIGGALIFSSGLSILKIRDSKTLNLLPALLVPVLFFLIKELF